MRKFVLIGVIIAIITAGNTQGIREYPGKISVKAKQTNRFCQYQVLFKNLRPDSMKFAYQIKSRRISNGNRSDMIQGGKAVCPPNDSLLLAGNRLNWLPGDSLSLYISITVDGKILLEENKVLFNKSD